MMQSEVAAMIHRPLAKLLFLLLAYGATLSVAYAADFYWRDSYGRGVGSGVSANCGNDKYDWGLCYPKCNDGYEGRGTVCWKRTAPFSVCQYSISYSPSSTPEICACTSVKRVRVSFRGRVFS